MRDTSGWLLAPTDVAAIRGYRALLHHWQMLRNGNSATGVRIKMKEIL